MNFLELLTEVRTVLQEPTAAFWSDSILKSFINDGDLRVCMDLQLGDTFRDTTTVAGQQCYPLPDYTFNIDRVLYGTSLNRLRKITDGIDSLGTSEGTPYQYIIPDGTSKIYLDPIPSASGTTIRLCGRFKSADMTEDTDEPECNAMFHRAIIHWACMKAFNMRKDSQQAGDAMSLYRASIAGFGGHVSTEGPKRLNRSAYTGSVGKNWRYR